MNESANMNFEKVKVITHRFLLHEEGLVSALFTTDGKHPVETNRQTRIPISGDPEALDGLAAIILLTTSSVTVPAKSPSVNSQRCESDVNLIRTLARSGPLMTALNIQSAPASWFGNALPLVLTSEVTSWGKPSQTSCSGQNPCPLFCVLWGQSLVPQVSLYTVTLQRVCLPHALGPPLGWGQDPEICPVSPAPNSAGLCV